MRSEPIGDEELLFLVAQTDARLFSAGMELRHRILNVQSAVMAEFGYSSFVLFGPGKPPLLDRIQAAFRQIYSSHDLAMGGHIGVYMFRDVFVRIRVPLIYGETALAAFDHLDLTPAQRSILAHDQAEMQKCDDQFLDVIDIQYGIGELKPEYTSNADLLGFLQNSRIHLHGAAAVLTGGYDYRGAIQSSLLATELALKGGVAAQGITEKEIKKRFGHSQSALLKMIGQRYTSLDAGRIERVLSKQPPLVGNRYSSEQPRRREAGEIAMGAQYVVSEVVRQLSQRDIRADNPHSPPRAYPA